VVGDPVPTHAPQHHRRSKTLVWGFLKLMKRNSSVHLKSCEYAYSKCVYLVLAIGVAIQFCDDMLGGSVTDNVMGREGYDATNDCIDLSVPTARSRWNLHSACRERQYVTGDFAYYKREGTRAPCLLYGQSMSSLHTGNFLNVLHKESCFLRVYLQLARWCWRRLLRGAAL